MTHRIYVTWAGHRKGCSTRRKLPGIRRGEWAHGGGAPVARDTALAIAASLRTRGHAARVVDLEGRPVVVPPMVSRFRARAEAQMRKSVERARSGARPAPQLRLFGGAA